MAENAPVKETCIQAACFFLPFFEAGEWRTRDKSPWKKLRKRQMNAREIRKLAEYTGNRIARCAEVMEFLQAIHDDWNITVKKKGVWMETQTMKYEDILPKLEAAGFVPEDYELYSEYTRKWGMI
ncbi:hypothetical protein [Curtanaerobium respiraculi]|uniref:hypothetical protein n=1 Tax=Curtanaerobium respiraculi TaxID=2949669 RepID=UPI0024B32E96|nr:hypothetical protein [Curtanaerobium respiraculi]